LGGVGGPVIPYVDGKPILEYTDIFAQMSWYGRRITNSMKIPKKILEVDFLRGANMSFRRSAIDIFDENLLSYWRRFEDDACFSVKAKGYKIICDPSLGVLHNQAIENGKQFVDLTPLTIVGFHHNSIYIKLKHLKGIRRAVCLLYEFIWGDETTPGCLQILLYGIKHLQFSKFRELWYALAGKLKGIQTYLKHNRIVSKVL
jgi:GT2 family glycosyltransferase